MASWSCKKHPKAGNYDAWYDHRRKVRHEGGCVVCVREKRKKLHTNRICRTCKKPVYCGVKNHFCKAMAAKRKERLREHWRGFVTVLPQTYTGLKSVLVTDGSRVKYYSWHILARKNWFRDLNRMIARDWT